MPLVPCPSLRRLPAIAGLALALLALPAPAAAGDGEPRRIDPGSVDPETLIEALTPDAPPPADLPPPGARGLATPEVDCEFFRGQAARGIRPTAASGTEVVSLRVHFAFDSAEILPEAAEQLDSLGRALGSGGLEACCFRLEGHTDSIGSDAYNLELSSRRARSVADYLAERFDVDRERMLTEGRGEEEPVEPNHSEAGRAENRRVQIVNLGYGAVQQ